MSFAAMRLEIADGLARLVFTDAVRGNPIDAIFCAEICEAAIQLSVNSVVRCVLITAEGEAFSYGGDIGAFVSDLDGLPANIKRWTTTLHVGFCRRKRHRGGGGQRAVRRRLCRHRL